YAGSNASLSTNLSNAPNGATPSSSLGSFSAGQATAKIGRASCRERRKMTITDTAGTKATGDDTSKDSNMFTVDPPGLDHFARSTIGTHTAGVQFTTSATAYSSVDNVYTNYAGSNASLSTNLSNAPNGATPSSSLGSFSAGQATA